MNPDYIDSHAHVQFPAYDADRNEVLARARNARIWMVNIGTAWQTSCAAVELAEHSGGGIYATAGVHPHHATESSYDADEFGAARETLAPAEQFEYDAYKKLANHARVVAIGECGLDYSRASEDAKKAQERLFLEHIRLAIEVQKPLMIHCREAFPDLVRIMRGHYRELAGGIAHFFSGSREEADALLDMGFFFSFGGVITFTDAYDELVRTLPFGNILLETDAPYVAPVPYRGTRNEPLYVSQVASRIAELRGTSAGVVGETTTVNAFSIFGLAK